jgi:phage shock protein C
VDLALVRILWLCAVLIFGTGVLAYIVCWLVMPLETRRAAGPAYSN